MQFKITPIINKIPQSCQNMRHRWFETPNTSFFIIFSRVFRGPKSKKICFWRKQSLFPIFRRTALFDPCFLFCLHVKCGEYHSQFLSLSSGLLFHPINTIILEFPPIVEWQLTQLICECTVGKKLWTERSINRVIFISTDVLYSLFQFIVVIE